MKPIKSLIPPPKPWSARTFASPPMLWAGPPLSRQQYKPSVKTQHPPLPSIPDRVASDSGSSSLTTSPTTPLLHGQQKQEFVELFAAPLPWQYQAHTNGDWTFNISATAALSDGRFSITAIATDADGNASPSSAALNITIDTSAPNFTSGGSTTAINENSGANQLIYAASTTDASAVVFTLKANNDDASDFSIDSSLGEVTLKANPDYKNNPLIVSRSSPPMALEILRDIGVSGRQ